MIMKFLLVQINKRFSSYTRFIVHKYTFVGSDTLVTKVNDSRKLNITTKDCLKKNRITSYYFILLFQEFLNNNNITNIHTNIINKRIIYIRI